MTVRIGAKLCRNRHVTKGQSGMMASRTSKSLTDDNEPRTRDMLLDAWRGISVLLVIVYHLTEFRFGAIFRPNHGDGSNTMQEAHGLGAWIKKQILRELEYAGPLGVQIFFVISGFIITTLLIREHRRNGRVSLSAFYVRRALRILPPLWLMLITTLILSSLGYIFVERRPFILAASFLCNTQPNNCSWFTGHTWSLAIEEQFYLIWPMLLTMLGFRGTAPLALTLCILFLAADQTSLLTVAWLHNGLSGACVAAGALYASSDTFRSMLRRAASLPLILAAIVLLFTAPFLRRYDVPIVERTLTPFLIVFVVFSITQFRTSLEHRLVILALSRIGVISYGLYLWQQLFLGEPSSYSRPSILQFPPACIIVVLLSYFLMEKPLVKAATRISRRLINRTSAYLPKSTTAF